MRTTPRFARRRSSRLALVSLACSCLGATLAGGLFGCVASPTEVAEAEAWRPAVVGARDGLEARWWVVDDADQALARTLAKYAERPAPIGELRAEDWRRAGLRIVGVTPEEAEALRVELPTIGADVRQWFGELRSWTEVVKGGRAGAGSAVRLHDGDLSLPAGRLRLLARCYRLPSVDERGLPRMRLELTPQLERERGLAADLRRVLGEAVGLRSSGPVFETLAVSWVVEPGMVYLVLPESPEADWVTIAAAPRPETDADLAEAELARADRGPAGVGPSAPTLPTLGEAMLGSPDRLPGLSGPRAILVLTPTVSGPLELIPG